MVNKHQKEELLEFRSMIINPMENDKDSLTGEETGTVYNELQHKVSGVTTQRHNAPSNKYVYIMERIDAILLYHS